MVETVEERRQEAFDEVAAYSLMIVTNGTLQRRALLSFLVDQERLRLIREDRSDLRATSTEWTTRTGFESRSLMSGA